MKEKSEEKPRFLIYRDPLREDMTEGEASIIIDRMKDESLTKEAFEALELAIDALKKQIPIPMTEEVDISGRPIRVCGNCGDAPGNGEFCRWCGQRIER